MLHNPENQRRLKIKDKNIQITHPGVLMQAHSSQFQRLDYDVPIRKIVDGC